MSKKYLHQQYLPIFLKITDKQILVVGGGLVAYQKICMLKGFDAKIVVVAKKISDEIRCVADIKIMEKEYKAKLLKGIYLAYACTNDPVINKKIKSDCKKQNILTNVVDDQKLCDFITPAIAKIDKTIVAVSSLGKNVKRAIRVRNKIKELTKNDKII